MPSFKKFILAPIFLLSFIFFLSQLSPIFKTYDFIFSISINALIPIVIVSASLLFASFSFALFYSLAQDWRIGLPVSLIASFTPLLFFDSTTAIILGIGSLMGFILTFFSLDNTLKTYIEFRPTFLLSPSIRHLSTLLIVIVCSLYYISINSIIQLNGFQIPDSLIDAAMQFSPLETETEPQSTPLPQLTPEQLKIAKQNPAALKQFGIDPKLLDSLDVSDLQPAQISSTLIKETLKDQFDKMIKPYFNWIPVLLSVLLFFLLQTINSLLNLLLYPLLWICFYIFEKTGFVKFVIEERPVKKMVV